MTSNCLLAFANGWQDGDSGMTAEARLLVGQATSAADAGDAWASVLRLRELLAVPGPLGGLWAVAVRVAEGIGDEGGALAAARRLYGESPADREAAFLLASVMTEVGHADRAVDLLLPIADSGRLLPNQQFKLTRMLMFAGRIDEAQERARRLLVNAPASATLWERIAQTKTFCVGDTDIDTMRQLFERTPESRPAARSAIAAALGKAYVDVGDDAAAATALEARAAAQRRRFPFESGPWRRAALATLDAFRDLEQAREISVPVGATRPIFIIGPPRSGTSLVDQVFSRHSWINGGGELRAFALATRTLGTWSSADLQAWLARTAAAGVDPWGEIGRRYSVLVQERFGEGAQFTDKLLSNVHRVGAIVRALPQAAIVHVERNALDVAWSCWRAQLDSDSAWSASPEGIACYLKYFTTAMRTWDELSPGRVARVAYEDLVRHPGEIIPTLLRACGLPEEPATLEPHRSSRPVATLSYAQVREPIHARRVNAARDFPLATRALVRALEREGLEAECC